MIKYFLLISILVLSGCSTTFAKKDQLMLVVPPILLEPPKELQEL